MDCIKLLLEAGGDVNLQDKEGEINADWGPSAWQKQCTTRSHMQLQKTGSAKKSRLCTVSYDLSSRLLLLPSHTAHTALETSFGQAPLHIAPSCMYTAARAMLHLSSTRNPTLLFIRLQPPVHGIQLHVHHCCECAATVTNAPSPFSSPVGYTPLHMASGYMHTAAMAALLEAAADPQLKDNNGRDVVQLVDGLRAQMPLNPTTITRRIALEQVAGVLSERVYEEVQPAQVCSRGWFGRGECGLEQGAGLLSERVYEELQPAQVC